MREIELGKPDLEFCMKSPLGALSSTIEQKKHSLDSALAVPALRGCPGSIPANLILAVHNCLGNNFYYFFSLSAQSDKKKWRNH